MKILSQASNSVATFSWCKKHRFTLSREYALQPTDRKLNFIMLNPSTADQKYNDPTIARCEKFALREGFKYLTITNIFSYRATDPKDMKLAAPKVHEVIKEFNDDHIVQTAADSDMIICGWGNHGSFLGRSAEVRQLLKPYEAKVYALEVNGSGEPKHPLYISGNRIPELFNLNTEKL